MSKLNKRREKERLFHDAREELIQLRGSLDSAYSVFNNTADPELLEACIFEISALQSKYGRTLRDLKTIGGE